MFTIVTPAHDEIHSKTPSSIFVTATVQSAQLDFAWAKTLDILTRAKSALV